MLNDRIDAAYMAWALQQLGEDRDRRFAKEYPEMHQIKVEAEAMQNAVAMAVQRAFSTTNLLVATARAIEVRARMDQSDPDELLKLARALEIATNIKKALP